MEDGKVSSFAAAKSRLAEKDPDERVIGAARELLARCESGQVRGFLVLGVTADGFASAAEGRISLGDLMLAFEDWKLGQLMARRQ